MFAGVAALLSQGCLRGAGLEKPPKVEECAVATDCCMSFRDLFKLAKGREWTEAETKHFKSIDQPERNRLVKVLAAEAGCVQTEDRTGTDGQVYTAFWLNQRACNSAAQRTTPTP